MIAAMILVGLLLAVAANKTDPEQDEGRPVPPGPLGSSGHRDLSRVSGWDVSGYRVVVGMGDDGLWDWRVWKSDVHMSEGDIDGLEEAQGFDSPDERTALARATAWVRRQPDVPEAGDRQAHGLRVSQDCSSITVSDLGMWLRFSTPRIETYDVANPQAEVIARVLLDAAFPDCGFRSALRVPTIRGTPWETTMERAQSTIQQIVDGNLLAVQPAEEIVAARLVGMSAPGIPDALAEWHVGTRSGRTYSLVVTPSQPPGRHLWRAWVGAPGRREDIAGTGHELTPARAMTAARAWADLQG
jgi:hypothetical protein